MAFKNIIAFTVFICYTSLVISFVKAEPAMAGFSQVELCIENCAVCKKMLGEWFEGPRCAEACIRHRGTPIPDCEDFASIAPFLTKI
ncbi:Eclosion hormone [Papilio machaon]|uniref:Eclosion hormone n=1 Tax=Papilio machaon TaxID=76193 RepID=A0A0N1PH64_PAPMA|nr:Eclosion hormone [Papilio machaon]